MQLAPRLNAAADYVRQGAVLADVGTDHAYLPIYLLLSSKIGFAHLSDINRGPLERARDNVIRNSLSDKVEYHLTSGASDLASLGITDYAVCGMGGELIRDIISLAPHLFDEKINLVLQPMTKPEILREFLFENGFKILSETFVLDEGKYYVVINARYSGERQSFTRADLYLGKMDSFCMSEAAEGYLKQKAKTQDKVARGKEEGGLDSSTERELLLAINERLSLFGSENK